MLYHNCLYTGGDMKSMNHFLMFFFVGKMEELSQALASSFSVSQDLNSIAAPHPRLSQYKSKHSSLEQNERRRRLLELQKS